MAGMLGFHLVEVGYGTALFEGVAGPAHLNALGGVHGGFALALVDSACGCAGHSTLAAGEAYTTVETKANLTRPIPTDGTPVQCTGTVVTRGRKLIVVEAKLTLPDGKVAAVGTSTLIVL
ncbi:PaaI family thioesterase [Oceanomicrobium pacificus]|nr:PaaI family thioesterase [Oceanomicrobium pacificus]